MNRCVPCVLSKSGIWKIHRLRAAVGGGVAAGSAPQVCGCIRMDVFRTELPRLGRIVMGIVSAFGRARRFVSGGGPTGNAASRTDSDMTSPRRTVAYYRVSTTRQAQTGSQAEEFGASIASQQAACQRYASQHQLDIIAEYVEPGGTATAIDRRPQFRQLLDRVLNQRDVEVVLVYTRSRAFRNAFEAMVIREEFRKIDVELLSVQEPCETGPEGDLVTLILDGVNEYQSRKLGMDVSFKMAATAARGSTPGRAKLGYRNTRAHVDGRSTPGIEIDPERAPYIGTAFRLFASGQYTLRRLRDELSHAGLRTRPTKTRPAGAPVTITQLTKLLRDRTYLGFVQWCGEEYPGNHPALGSV